MSLSYDDLQAIRQIVEEVVNPIRGDIEALSSDIKEIYEMIAELQKKPTSEESFQKLNIEQKLLKLNAELLAAAKQAGISLPR